LNATGLAIKPITGIVGRFTSIDWGACISVILQQKITRQKSLDQLQAQGSYMKQVALLLLVALLLNGCSGSNSPVQQASGSVWQAQLSGGTGSASGLSFITQFTINGGGSLSISNFQLLNAGTCLPVTTGDSASGSITNLDVVSTSGAVTGDFSFTVQGNSNTLTLTGTLTGTETGAQLGTTDVGTFTAATITGSWTLSGATTCTDAGGDTSFIMTLCTSGGSCPTTTT
jgi:hypothetical protein